MGHLLFHKVHLDEKTKCPRQESNLVFDLRGVACKIRHTPRTFYDYSALPRNRTSSNSFEDCCAIRHTRKAYFLKSHLHQLSRADDWIRTSMNRFTGPAPFSVEPRRQAGVQGFEPCRTVLEAVCSPRSTPLYCPLRFGREQSITVEVPRSSTLR
jgi:hypothetical protein